MEQSTKCNRRAFFQSSAAGLGGMLTYGCVSSEKKARALRLASPSTIGNIFIDGAKTPLDGATWYEAQDTGHGLLYRFESGRLKDLKTLTSDILLAGRHMACFLIELQEGDDGPAFGLNFKLLNQCSARIRMGLDLVNLNEWKLPREGAWLKPICQGQRVALEKVDRIRFTLYRNGGKPVRWCMTDFTVTARDVPILSKLILPKGKLVDEMGQSRFHDWPGKSKTPEEVTQRIRKQYENASKSRWPKQFSNYGGWTRQRFEAKGVFYPLKDGKRWWLVDPEGYAFWSAGLDCVRVDTAANIRGIHDTLSWMPDPAGEYKDMLSGNGNRINYLTGNLIRAFGPEKWADQWKVLALSQLKAFGFNTVANWSDWKIAKEAGVPYVRPLSLRLRDTPKIYRSFPDVFAASYAREAKEYAGQLHETKSDPAFIGYFLMNEPNWAFSSEVPAAGMLFNTPQCETRKALAAFLGSCYSSSADLSDAWGIQTTLNKIERGRWTTRLTEKALSDLADFSEIMVERFFKTLTDACREVDAVHMNLGVRYHKVPPAWALKGMSYFDVFSMNCYRQRIQHDEIKEIEKLLNMPVMIGEFHFGALDVGLPATGIGHVPDQEGRGKAYRIYVEDAAADPNCVGTHWFIMYDQSALGRGDGENYNIGFLDVCHRPYEPLVKAARETHEKIYEVAAGKRKVYDDAPEYLPLLF